MCGQGHGIGSFSFIGILKIIFHGVKHLFKEADVDDEAEDLRKTVSSVVNKNIAKTCGL